MDNPLGRFKSAFTALIGLTHVVVAIHCAPSGLETSPTRWLCKPDFKTLSGLETSPTRGLCKPDFKTLSGLETSPTRWLCKPDFKTLSGLETSPTRWLCKPDFKTLSGLETPPTILVHTIFVAHPVSLRYKARPSFPLLKSA